MQQTHTLVLTLAVLAACAWPALAADSFTLTAAAPADMLFAPAIATTDTFLYAALLEINSTTSARTAQVTINRCELDLSACPLRLAIAMSGSSITTVPQASSSVQAAAIQLTSTSLPVGAVAVGPDIFTYVCNDANCASPTVTKHTPTLSYASSTLASVRVVLGANDVMTIFAGTDREPLNICLCADAVCSAITCTQTADDSFGFDARLNAAGFPALLWAAAPPTRCSSTNVAQDLRLSTCADAGCTSFSSTNIVLANVLDCSSGFTSYGEVTLGFTSSGAFIVAPVHTSGTVSGWAFTCPDQECTTSSSGFRLEAAFYNPPSIQHPDRPFSVRPNKQPPSFPATAQIKQCTSTACGAVASASVGITRYEGSAIDAALTSTHSYVIASYSEPDAVSSDQTNVAIFRGTLPSGSSSSPALGLAPAPLALSAVLALAAAVAAVVF